MRGDRHRVGDQGLRRRRHRVDGQALPGPRHRDDRQPRHAARRRLDAWPRSRSTTCRPSRPPSAKSAPAVMLSHLDLTAIAPGVPASMAPEVYELLRDDLGFEGVTITDSLGMGAVGGRPKPAVQALNAGADLLLMPVDTADDPRDRHRGDRVGRGLARAGRGGRRPGRRTADVAGQDRCRAPGARRRRRAGPGGERGPRGSGVLTPWTTQARPDAWSGRACRRGAADGGSWLCQAARSGSPARRSFCSASRSSWRTRSAEMPCRAPMSASLCWRPSARP